MLLSFSIFCLKFLFIKGDYFCNKNEIKIKTWCYKLISINLILNFDNCTLQSQLCVKRELDKLLDLYLVNPILESGYEFTALKSQRKFESTNLVNSLLEQNDIKKNFTFKILFNLYSYENHGYLNNQPFKIGNPNLLKHADEHQDDNSTEKCLFVHQTQNFNEKFTFKYGNCYKNYSFICIKEPRKIDDFKNRCSSYAESNLGGKWIECDQVFKIVEGQHMMSKSQKCCLYNLNWKVDFYSANKICSQFGSEVFTFKAKGYKSILNSYDFYMDQNFNETKFLNFWTSCKLFDYPNANEPDCSRDKLDEKVDDYDFYYPNENGFIIYYLNYSFKNYLLSKSINYNLHTFNLTNIYINLNQTIHITEFIQNLTQNTFILVRRKENHFSSLTAKLSDSENRECFSYNQSSHVSVSLPFLNKCFHFTTLVTQNYTKLSHVENINEVLNMIDIFEIECTHDLNSTKLVIKFDSNNCSYYKLKKERYSYNKISDWKKNLWNFMLMKNSYLTFSNYTKIEKILELNCYDNAFKIYYLIQECQIFNDDFYCKFKCPEDCDFYRDKNQVLVWQIASFKYLYHSSICKSAYHSSLNKGLIHFSEYNEYKSNSDDLIILNNGIESIKWDLKDRKYFYFSSNSVNLKRSKESFENSLILIKAVHYSDKINLINIKFLSCAKPDLIVLKYLIPFYDEFYESPFIQETRSFGDYFETSLKVNISQKQLTFINNYYEVNGIKFPINIINKENDNLKLNLFHVFNTDGKFSSNFPETNNISYLKNCVWYVYNLNTHIPCSNKLELNQSFQQSLIFYPKIERLNLKRFIRVIVSKEVERCSNNGFLLQNSCICYPGFGGNNCEIICPEGFFGYNCEFECPNRNCFGYLICNKDPIGCSCASGFTGYNCDQNCSKNTWGPKCMLKCDFCFSNECNKYNGSCVCKQNSYGKYCEKCSDGFYGPNCTDLCEDNCLKCEKQNGSCKLWTKAKTSAISQTLTSSMMSIQSYFSKETFNYSTTIISTTKSSSEKFSNTKLQTLSDQITPFEIKTTNIISKNGSLSILNITKNLDPKENFQTRECNSYDENLLVMISILIFLFYFTLERVVDFFKNKKTLFETEEKFLFNFDFNTILPSSI